MLRTHEYSDVFNTLGEIYLVFTSKSKYPLYILSVHLKKVNILYIYSEKATYIYKKRLDGLILVVSLCTCHFSGERYADRYNACTL